MDVDEAERLETCNEEMQSDGSDESENESSDSDESETAESDEIRNLRDQIKYNPYYYDGHLKLISSLRELSNLEKLRDARENMSSVFPLTEELWLEWIHDELPLAVIPDRKEYIISLFEKAAKDYISVKVWTEYCQFLMDRIDDAESIQHVRNIFERAIMAAGLHLTEGSSLWEGYRELEMSILQSYQQLAAVEGGEETPGLQQKIEDQVSRVMSLFKRQLTIPLLGMQQTMRDFEDWAPEPVSDVVENSYQKALKNMEERLNYEQALNTAPAPKQAEYNSYIAFEIKEGNPPRVQCIFERAIRDNCLEASIWSQYTNYLDHKLKVSSVCIPAHERAVRNCPWISVLWQNYIRALERNQSDKGRVKATLDQALQCGFASSDDYLQLWLTYLDYLRRRITNIKEDLKAVEDLRKAFQNAIDHIKTHCGEDGDQFGLIPRYWAFFEVRYCQNIRKAQELWDGVMKIHGKQAHMWLEYTNFLRIHGDAVLTRQVFQRAVQLNMDYPETVCSAFMTFEREEGNLIQYDSAHQRTEETLRKCLRKKQQEEQKDTDMQQARMQQMEHKKEERKKKKLEKRKQDRGARKARDVKPEEKIQSSNPTMPADEEPPQKKLKPDPNAAPNVSETSDVQSEVNSEPNPVDEKTRKKEDSKTVFLSNLLFTVNEDHISEKFSSCGEILEIRLVKNRFGKSKGYAYLEFKDESSVAKALDMDRALLDGRPVFVSPMTDKSKHPTQFKFATSLDKYTVFVSNLPFMITEEAIHTHFKESGKIKQVRLVTNRAGKQKGYGYVEFEDEASASNAVMKFDGSSIGDRTIQVALSNPPSRKWKKDENVQEVEKPPIYGSRGKARTQLAMMPRALSKPKKPETEMAPDATKDTLEQKEVKKLSNAEFRKFLRH